MSTIADLATIEQGSRGQLVSTSANLPTTPWRRGVNYCLPLPICHPVVGRISTSTCSRLLKTPTVWLADSAVVVKIGSHYKYGALRTPCKDVDIKATTGGEGLGMSVKLISTKLTNLVSLEQTFQ